MTAEIAILNKSGIALAADSAVTIGDQKVYNSANKLFTLSKYQPVGIMVYDSADLMGIPWELIIKEYRAILGDRVDSLEEYAADFWRYLASNRDVVPTDIRNEYREILIDTFLSILYNRLDSNVETLIKEGADVTLESTKEILKDVLDESEAFLRSTSFVENADEESIRAIREEYRGALEALVHSKFGELFLLLDSDFKERIYSQLAEICVRERYILKTSGVVIAGYGKLDIFPKIASYFVEGITDALIKKSFNAGKSNVQHSGFATFIVPFAQDEMVWTFLQGIDPEISAFASSYLDDVFKQYAKALDSNSLGIDEETMARVQEQIAADSTALLETFKSDLAQFQRDNNTQPILDMVGVLPKDELAAMAESLVNLTVFKRKISKSVETVGGPIDVAIISKGDGFVWVKRKHYFKPELNQHFFANYYRGK